MKKYRAMRYYLLDGAKCNDALDETLKQATKYLSLYKGRSEENLASVAPYLIVADTNFQQWIQKNGWGDSWGYFLESDLPFEAVYSHFRKFLIVEDEDFKPLYFRFYDPRVIRLFLPTCDSKQLQTFLDPVDYIISEMPDDKEKLELYRVEGGKLKVTQASIESYFEKPTWNLEQSSPFSPVQSEQTPQVKPSDAAAEENSKSKRRFIY